jgi:uncharacterized protein YdaU (DUF1376 family)
MEHAPAFQFYPKDFLTDGHVAAMALAEVGAYIKLLCLCWQDGSLPCETSRLARMVGEPEASFRRLWPALEPCFRKVDGGRLINPRLELERQKQAARREAGREAGIKGAAIRWPRTNR